VGSITLQEAQARLPDLVRQLAAGGEVTITEGQRPVARLVGVASGPRTRRPRPPVTGVPKAGQYEGRLVVPDDIDAPLDELREYSE
jgi:prevent-host-death family protein